MDQSVLTIATGKPYYIQLAVNLARSFFYWHSEDSIPFYLVTDNKNYIPEDIASKINIIEIDANEFGNGFSTKLYIDHFAQTKKTLFIDADCIIYGNLMQVFAEFVGHSVSVIGENMEKGDFFCDIIQIRKLFNLTYLPKFVGGIYYIEKNDICKNVFDLARQLKSKYDEIGLIRLRGKENEEPLIAIAMATYNQQPKIDNGNIKADRMLYLHLKSNVLEGKAYLWSNGAYPIPAYLQREEATPLIVHYNAYFAENYEYYSEVKRLNKVQLSKYPKWLANVLVELSCVLPGKLKKNFKKLLKPLYRSIFGIRPIKKSQRI